MPIINFTTGDILRSKLIEEGWYGAEITQITGPVQAKTGNGVNFTFDFTLDEKSPAPGKVITRTFNSQAIGMMVPMVAACKGLTPDQVAEKGAFTLDTDECLHKKLDVKVIKDLYEGQWNNKVEGGFAPAGTMVGKVPAF